MDSKLSSRRDLLKAMGISAAALAVSGCVSLDEQLTRKKSKKPNFVIFFTDDQGYNDVGCFGSPLIKTPCFDQMAKEGMKFTDFYAQPVCGPSRAAIMTGCYPIRVAEPNNTKNPHPVLHTKEITLAEILKEAGYTTACIGKWHLAGSRSRGIGPFPPELMPNRQGFDYFYGIPMVNGASREPHDKFICELYRNEKRIVENANDMIDSMTQNMTKEAIQFIHKSKHQPFFLYLSHPMPHVPLGASEKFKGKSKRGLYGDAVEELDWSMGKIIDVLKELQLDEDTLIVFTSDNGPWRDDYPWLEDRFKRIGDHGGSAEPLRGSKIMTWDGGLRVPCIMRWPGRIPAGKVCSEIVTTMDLLPTLAYLAGTKPPQDRIIDGKDIWPIMSGQKNAKSPHKAFYYYCYLNLHAVRSGKWKLVLPREKPNKPDWYAFNYPLIEGVPLLQLYNLETDIGEKHNVADNHPEVVARLIRLAEKTREDLGDYNRVGKGARFFDRPRPTTRTTYAWLTPEKRQQKKNGSE